MMTEGCIARLGCDKKGLAMAAKRVDRKEKGQDAQRSETKGDEGE
jgi:hypothetical protein